MIGTASTWWHRYVLAFGSIAAAFALGFTPNEWRWYGVIVVAAAAYTFGGYSSLEMASDTLASLHLKIVQSTPEPPAT
jgi:hypothetical protein